MEAATVAKQTLSQPTQVYQVFIKSTPEQIWQAITDPDFTTRYFHGSRVELKLVAGSEYRGYSPDRSQLWVDGEVVEVDAPRRLVHTWRARYEPDMAQEEPSRVTWDIEEREGGMCLLTVVHDQLDGAPKTAQSVSGEGWMYVLSGLKTVLETGQALPAFQQQ
jgi:uncharacterized protein YndB with AHSA1/START domain